MTSSKQPANSTFPSTLTQRRQQTTMVFSWPEFNKQYRYYWWLLPTQPDGDWGWRTPDVIPWPRAPPPADVEMSDPRDYPNKDPPLNRSCRDNIHLTILTEYDTIWPLQDHLDLYFRVHASMSKRLIARIVTQGLANIQYKAYHPDIVVKLITSYLPSELPVDDDGFRALAEQR